MTHYQKLAAMIFRSVGVILIIFSLISALTTFVLEFSGKYTLFFFTLLPYLTMGVILIASGKFLAKLICNGFDKND